MNDTLFLVMQELRGLTGAVGADALFFEPRQHVRHEAVHTGGS